MPNGAADAECSCRCLILQQVLNAVASTPRSSDSMATAGRPESDGPTCQLHEGASDDLPGPGANSPPQDSLAHLDGIEERARYDLGMVKKGETFFMIVDDKPEAAQ